MAPDQIVDGPARWKLIEATNGYDVDNSSYQVPTPVPPGLPARSRSVRPGQAIGRLLLALSAAHRRRREQPVGHAGATSSNV